MRSDDLSVSDDDDDDDDDDDMIATNGKLLPIGSQFLTSEVNSSSWQTQMHPKCTICASQNHRNNRTFIIRVTDSHDSAIMPF